MLEKLACYICDRYVDCNTRERASSQQWQYLHHVIICTLGKTHLLGSPGIGGILSSDSLLLSNALLEIQIVIALLDLLGCSLLLSSSSRLLLGLGGRLLLGRLHLGSSFALRRRLDLGSGGRQDTLYDLAHRGLNGARRVGIRKGTGSDEGQSSTRGSKESLIGVVVIRLQFICTASYPTDET